MAGALMGQWKVGMGSQMKERSRVGEEGGRAFFPVVDGGRRRGLGNFWGAFKVAQTRSWVVVVRQGPPGTT